MLATSTSTHLARAGALALLGCALAPLAPPAAADSCETPFVQPDAASGDDFGYGVAISGDTAVVGARNDDDAGSGSGAAYVYVRSSGGWVLQQKLTADDAAAGANFGWDVAIDGDTLVVGATENGAFGTGAAYVFVRSGTVWSQEGKLTPSLPSALASYASSVDLDGDTVVVGAPHPQNTFPQIGEAYVYVRTGTTWSEQQRVLADDAAAGEWFGTNVSVSGDRIAVGASKDDPNGTDSGSAYVFVRSGTTWTQQQKLDASDGFGLDRFGAAVALDGDDLVVGAWGADPDGQSSAGAAYHFAWNGSAWTERQKLIASDAAAGLFFGGSLHLDGNQLLVGANIGGAAYAFLRPGDAWLETDVLVGTGTAPGDSFGFSVGLEGGSAVVGAHLTGSAGAAFAYELSAGRKLFGCPTQVSLVAGGAQDLALDAGSANAFGLYYLLTTTAGTAPGTALPPTALALPLNASPLLLFTALNPNLLVPSSLDFLDGSGERALALSLPPGLDPGLAGVTLDSAYLLLDVATFNATLVSEPVPLGLLP